MTHEERVEVFDQLRAKHLRFLTAVLWKLTGAREIFAEAMQYALLGLWCHLEKLEGDKAQSYLYRIALSANSKAWRNRVGRDGTLPGRVDRYGGSGRETGRTELHRAVRQAMARLPERQGRAVTMRYLEQKDYEDIATRLGCSEATARSHVSKAIATLKRRLAPKIQWERDDGER
jgi:RNA polymerase sigma factor (sigma-70 family)